MDPDTRTNCEMERELLENPDLGRYSCPHLSDWNTCMICQALEKDRQAQERAASEVNAPGVPPPFAHGFSPWGSLGRFSDTAELWAAFQQDTDWFGTTEAPQHSDAQLFEFSETLDSEEKMAKCDGKM